MKTFNELLTTATKGPFKVGHCTSDGPGGDVKTSVDLDDFTYRTLFYVSSARRNKPIHGTPVDAELVARLLNWAHAGGVETLNEMWTAMCDWMPEDFDDSEHEANVNEQFKRAERMIEILNGKTP